MVTARPEEEFIVQAAASGAEIKKFSGPDNALAFVSQFLSEQGLKSIAVAPGVSLPPARMDSWPVLKPKKKEDYLAAEASLVRADYGISDTGTLVCLDQNEEEKIIWTLPPVCLCLLEVHRIVRDLDAIAEILSGHLSRTTLKAPQVSLVTGPSRTADIEGQICLGVHGPSRLVVLLVEGTTSGPHEKD